MSHLVRHLEILAVPLTRTSSDLTSVGWYDCALVNILCRIHFWRSAVTSFVFLVFHLKLHDPRCFRDHDCLVVNRR